MTPPEYQAAVAAEVRAEMARQHKGLGDLAQALDISRPTASRRLSGDAAWDVAELMQVALWLAVPVDRFYAQMGEVTA